MTNDTLKDWLATYAAPTYDNGFSDAVMKTLDAEAQETEIDLSVLSARPGRAWRGWVVAWVLGITAGLLWSWSGVQLPQTNLDLGLTWPPSTNWTLYTLCIVSVGLSLFLGEAEGV